MWLGIVMLADRQTGRQTDRQTHTHRERETRSLQYIATASAGEVIMGSEKRNIFKQNSREIAVRH